MANTYKNIVITPNRDTDAANVPFIRFSGGDATTNTDINVRVYTAQSGTLSFEGSAGQLFSITNDLSNSIFSVNDVSGIPSIDVYANGAIYLAPYGGQIFVGNTANLNFDSMSATKIIESAANTLAFYTTQIERMSIDSSGNVLIGRTTSAVGNNVKLDVNGAINTASILINGTALTAATQAEQETATSTTTYVSPGRQHFHPSAAKFWAHFGTSGNLLAGYNVTSITDGGGGNATVVIATDFSSADYCVGVSIENLDATIDSATDGMIAMIAAGNQAAGSVQVINKTDGGTAATDPTTWNVWGFGDLA
jgi:hypothetical protein